MQLNENKYLLTSLTRACKYKNNKVTHRFPIQKSLLSELLKIADAYFNELGQNYLLRLYKAIFVAAYYGMLRISEITSGAHPVLARDVHIGENKRKFLFILRTSKTHWSDGEPQLIKLTNTSVEAKIKSKSNNLVRKLCPYQILNEFLAVCPTCLNNSEAFFVFADHSPVKPYNMHSTLKLLLKKGGFVPANYNCHSFRIGRSVDLLTKFNISIEKIRKLGRWKSRCVYSYLTHA